MDVNVMLQCCIIVESRPKNKIQGGSCRWARIPGCQVLLQRIRDHSVGYGVHGL